MRLAAFCRFPESERFPTNHAVNMTQKLIGWKRRYEVCLRNFLKSGFRATSPLASRLAGEAETFGLEVSDVVQRQQRDFAELDVTAGNTRRFDKEMASRQRRAGPSLPSINRCTRELKIRPRAQTESRGGTAPRRAMGNASSYGQPY